MNRKRIAMAILLLCGLCVALTACTKFDTSAGYNSYCLEKVYYISAMLEELGDDSYVEPTAKIMKSADHYFENGSMTMIDEAAYICLLELTGEEDDLVQDKLDTFLTRRTDTETNLIYEYTQDDEIDEMAAFTAELVALFSSEDIELETSGYHSAIEAYLEETEFLTPDQEEECFLAGGQAIYAMYMVDSSYDFSDYEEWYEAWSAYFSEQELGSWDDYLAYSSGILAVREAFGDEAQVEEKMRAYRSQEHLQEFIDEYFDVTMAWKYFQDCTDEFDEDIRTQFAELETEKLDYYYDRLKK